MEKTLSFRPVFLAMLAAVFLVGLIQVGVDLLGGFGMTIVSQGELGLVDWLILGFSIGFVFLLYLGPAALLIRWIVERSTGVRAPLFRTALTFLSSFVLLALGFVAFGLFFSLQALTSGLSAVLLASAYVALGSALSARWFIAENDPARKSEVDKKDSDNSQDGLGAEKELEED